jgi:hypothetical protein
MKLLWRLGKEAIKYKTLYKRLNLAQNKNYSEH